MRPRRLRFGVLAPCIVALFLCTTWVRSYRWCDLVGVNTAPRNSPSAKLLIGQAVGQPTGVFVGVVTQFGKLYIVRFPVWNRRELRTGWNRNPIDDDPSEGSLDGMARHRFAGFSVHWELLEFPGFFVGIPLWLPLTACAMPLVVGRLRGRLRRRRGQCSQCGYDLRATPGTCPECGSGA